MNERELRNWLFPIDPHTENPLRQVCNFNGWAGGHYSPGETVPWTKCITAEDLWDLLTSLAESREMQPPAEPVIITHLYEEASDGEKRTLCSGDPMPFIPDGSYPQTPRHACSLCIHFAKEHHDS
jgi:hypothetical protein